MSTEVKLRAARETGTGRRAYMEITAYLQNGVLISPGGGSAVVVVNASGVNMARDALVYISGVNASGELEVALADANVDDRPAMYFLPLAILAGAKGLAYKSGLSVATLNTLAGSVDDPVFLSDVAGGWTLTAPTAAAAIDQIVGRVAVDSATVGQIMWHVGSAGDYDVGTNEIQDLAVTLGKMALITRGSIISGQTAGNVPTLLDCTTDGGIMIGDGADAAVFALTGSVAMTNAGLTSLTAGVENIGQGCVGYFYLTGVAANAETLVINGRTYEFTTGGGIVGDVAADITADQTADNACTVLAAAINGDGTRVVDAVVMAGNADRRSCCCGLGCGAWRLHRHCS